MADPIVAFANPRDLELVGVIRECLYHGNLDYMTIVFDFDPLTKWLESKIETAKFIATRST